MLEVLSGKLLKQAKESQYSDISIRFKLILSQSILRHGKNYYMMIIDSIHQEFLPLFY